MEMFDLGDFRLQCGATLPGARLAYKVHGTLNAARDNAILFPSFLGGAPEALEAWIGKGRPLDPGRYCIILPGHFGLPPTSSPSNTPTPYGRGAFPAVTIADDVIAQHRLLAEQFGIEQLQLVLGWSVGGLQTYEWAVRYPVMVRRMASIAGRAEAVAVDPALAAHGHRGAVDRRSRLARRLLRRPGRPAGRGAPGGPRAPR